MYQKEMLQELTEVKELLQTIKDHLEPRETKIKINGEEIAKSLTNHDKGATIQG